MNNDLIPRAPGIPVFESENPLTAIGRVRPDEALDSIMRERDAERAQALILQKHAAMASTSAKLSNIAEQWVASRGAGESLLEIESTVDFSEGFFNSNRKRVRARLRVRTR